jgi:hypothetical protein
LLQQPHTDARGPGRRGAGRMAVALAIVVALCGVSVQAADGATDTVTVTSTVGSVVSVADGCSSSIAIFVTLSAYQSGTCTFTFGSTNDPTTTLRISSSPGALMSGGVFADHSGGCGVLAADTTGVKVSTVGAGVSAGLGCTVSAAGTNGDFVAVPDAFTNTCQGTTLGSSANTCTLAVGLRAGAATPAGSYVGTINVDVIG